MTEPAKPPTMRRVRCDCCDEEVMAYDYGDRIVVERHHHGRKHTATIDLRPATRDVVRG